MFNLEQSIVAWRKQMLAAGIQAPVPLEELESHLREEIEWQLRSGESEPMAFAAAVQQIGGSAVLKPEFAKVGETIHERLKRLFCALGGIPEYQLATNMNVPNQNPEPGWATYLKSAVWIFPAIFVWIGCMVFLVPKLKEVGAVAKTQLPQSIQFELAVADLIKNNFLLGALIFLTMLVLLEWRWRGWARYRRLLSGIVGFCLNCSALFFLASLLVFAVLVASQLAHPR